MALISTSCLFLMIGMTATIGEDRIKLKKSREFDIINFASNNQ